MRKSFLKLKARFQLNGQSCQRPKSLDYNDKGDVVKIGDEKTKLAKTYIYSKQRIVSKEPIGDDIQITTFIRKTIALY